MDGQIKLKDCNMQKSKAKRIKTERLEIRLTKELLDEVNKYTNANNITKTRLINECLMTILNVDDKIRGKMKFN